MRNTRLAELGSSGPALDGARLLIALALEEQVGPVLGAPALAQRAEHLAEDVVVTGAMRSALGAILVQALDAHQLCGSSRPSPATRAIRSAA